MPAFINQAALSTVSMRSKALGPLDSIAHPLMKPGLYQGEVCSGDATVGRFSIEISAEGQGDQVDVDLDAIANRKARLKLSSGKFEEGTPVYAVFNSSLAQGYYVILTAPGGKKVDFDSRKLKNGDIYMTIPLQPGNYTIGDGGKLTGRLSVSEAKPGDKPRSFEPPPPVRLTEKGFVPKKINLMSGQPLVFEIGKTGMVELKLGGSKKKTYSAKSDGPLSRAVGRGQPAVKSKIDNSKGKKK